MSEDIGDFFALRGEKLQEDHLRTIYSSNSEYEKTHKEKYEKEIEKMRAETMAYVAEDHTESTFNKLYEENETLKEINEEAYNPFKTTGGVYKAGEQVAPVLATVAACTVAPESASVIVPVMIGVNSGGKATEEYLQKQKKSSREGIRQAYKDGDIDKETYESIEMIWNLSDSEMQTILNDNRISKEDKQKIQQIRNMKDNWTTEENRDNAITYGNAVGVWDATQYALGMNLFRFNPTGSKLVNAGTRVGIDTSLNAADTPFKASVYSVLDKDTDFKTVFEELGGMDAVKTSAVLGFAGSIFGEVVDSFKTKNNEIPTIINEIDNVELKQLTDNAINTDPKDMAATPFIDDYRNGYINLNGLSKDEINNLIISRIQSTGSPLSDTDSIFKYCYETGGNYGCNQGTFDQMYGFKTPDGRMISQRSAEYIQYQSQGINLPKYCYSNKYLEIKDRIVNRYKMSSNDASKTMAAIDSIGACSYADVANNIISHWKNNPQDFESIFGFPLYMQTDLGVLTLNDKELLADLFVFANKNTKKGIFESNKLFFEDINGATSVNDNGIIQDINRAAYIDKSIGQSYWSQSTGMDENLINKYLKSKSSGFLVNTRTLDKPELYKSYNGNYLRFSY